MTGPWEAVLPAGQRRDLEELTARLDLDLGDRHAKISGFWTMLVLSAIIAVAGVLGDSTATVIGAMIIAPLSVPIMGIALGIVRGDASQVVRSMGWVTAGVATVVTLGALASWPLPDAVGSVSNSQIAARTSPGILDMVAAVATGLAGAVGLARRDVSDVLPGVAIAISLVPPLGVVGICLGNGQPVLALGAFLLFLSNMVALVMAGTLVFTAYGYAREAALARGFNRRRANSAVAAVLVLVLVPLLSNTAANLAVAIWTQRVTAVAEEWLADVPGGRLTDVTVTSATAILDIEVPGALPDTAALLAALDGSIPTGIKVVVDAGVGERVEVGVVDGDGG
ncbi:MAG: TIGR00341 family protein [Actinomycetota bacterium]